MRFYSLNKQSPPVGFGEAAVLGQAPDKGLYFPESIPMQEKDFFQHIEKIPDDEIAFRVIKPYTGNEIPDDILYTIVRDAINFPIPLEKVADDVYSLELFHGPTMAFKDIGARFMSRCLAHFVKNKGQKLTVLVATSGDTGGAVADGFFEVPGVDVVILFPSGKVSHIQEKQLTSYGKNITALEVAGNFDDCQMMVKRAFVDKDLHAKLFLTSANSINVARWLPQQVYYFFAWKQWGYKNQPPVISVPSGNFGNIGAGLLAHISGLPVKHFIAACNANDVVPRFLDTGIYRPVKAIPTISNAMDVGDPSNFIRVMQMFNHSFVDVKKKMKAYRITDDETRLAMADLYENYNYQADPHGAVGYLSLQKFISENKGSKGIFLETAHPVKFLQEIKITGLSNTPFGKRIHELLAKPSHALKIEADYTALKEYLITS